jgi:CheY-like chemotaxis protein
VTPLPEPAILIDRAIALARRSAWHAKQSQDLAHDAQELLVRAASPKHELLPSMEAPRMAESSAIVVSPARTVLIVDDDQFVTDTFAMTLKLEGYEVVIARTAAAAGVAATVRWPDLIFLDLHLPSTDGLTLLRQLRAVPDQQATPVAVITGDYFLEDDVTRELIELGAQLRFKPIWTEDLVALTRALLQLPSN